MVHSALAHSCRRVAANPYMCTGRFEYGLSMAAEDTMAIQPPYSPPAP